VLPSYVNTQPHTVYNEMREKKRREKKRKLRTLSESMCLMRNKSKFKVTANDSREKKKKKKKKRNLIQSNNISITKANATIESL
jgi:hypothetical protein